MGQYLTGQLLIAMPNMADDRFTGSVIYLCAHSAEGAMGLIINKPAPGMSFPRLLEQVGIESTEASPPIQVYSGGPVEPSRGFVLHSADLVQDNSLRINDDMALTATLDMLKAIAEGVGPDQSLLALGYAGWGPGQLDQEIKANGWLSLEADLGLVFSPALDNKWEAALRKMRIDPRFLSDEAGHA